MSTEVTLSGGPAAGRVVVLKSGGGVSSIAVPVMEGEDFAKAIYGLDGSFLRLEPLVAPRPVAEGNGLTNWTELLAEAAGSDAIIARAPDDPTVWEHRFYAGFGGEEGEPVLAWSETRVYFPVSYDGSEWIESAPRNPRSTGQPHVGG